MAALQRIRRYLRSAGRYGPSPFLVGHYGGIGEISQGFCRAAAVGGATYILGRDILSVQSSENNNAQWSLQIDDLEERPKAHIIATSPDYHPSIGETSPSQGPSKRLARCIAVINQPFVFSPPSSSAPPNEETETSEGNDETATSGTIDTGLLIFPPGSVEGGSPDVAVTCLVSGEGTFAAPAGHCTYSYVVVRSDAYLSFFHRGPPSYLADINRPRERA